MDRQTDKQMDRIRMVVQGQLVEPAVCFSDLCDIFLEDKVRDTKQNHWTIKIYVIARSNILGGH